MSAITSPSNHGRGAYGSVPENDRPTGTAQDTCSSNEEGDKKGRLTFTGIYDIREPVY